MNRTVRNISLILSALLILTSSLAMAGTKGKSAIVLAHFGTTVVPGLESIINIEQEVRKAYPETEIRTTFTSNIIRSVWKKRQAEAEKWLAMGVPAEILHVKNVIATIGDLLEDGYTDIVVQPSHMFYMEQSHDLQQYVQALGSIRPIQTRWQPFHHLVMGRPALGMPGVDHPYHEDVAKVCETLAGDMAAANQSGAALVYMGHGNEHWSTGIYHETELVLRKMYPKTATYIGVVEGAPSLAEVVARLKQDNVKKVMLKPFMIVAGDHATNDMAGEEADSWKSVLEAASFDVEPVLKGLGTNDDFAAIFVAHIADAAKEAGIVLK